MPLNRKRYLSPVGKKNRINLVACLKKDPGILDSSAFSQPASNISVLLLKDSTYRAACISWHMGELLWKSWLQVLFQDEVENSVVSSYLLLFIIRERRVLQ